ncbi:MAG: hypothetical protein JO058_01135 [Alphaproteobacteria bacterium]|nr:hypothetical protein [Alphaproteobacteria bacterium]MBV9014240.1 hypothetical protein [Alphaproteobacteria bacterium]
MKNGTSAAPLQAKSWRDIFKIHPVTKLFPPMPLDQLKALGEDMNANGIQNKIVLFYDGIAPDSDLNPAWWRSPTHFKKILVLDGCNRMDAGEQFAGINWSEEYASAFTVKFREKAEIYKTPEFDPWAFAISVNLHRRHLTIEQKLELIDEVLKAQPQKSDNQIAKETQSSPTTVGKRRKAAEARGDVSTVKTRTDTKGRQQPARKPRQPKPTVVGAAETPSPEAIVLDSSTPAIGVPTSLSIEPAPLSKWSRTAPELLDMILSMLRDESALILALQLRTRAKFASDVMLALDVALNDCMSAAEAIE